ncbi:MAG: hypothetical protein CO032_02145, partial [Nitrosopumilales archaeon CG_4_9_14_0_2_um_filter_34_16]
MKDFPKKLDAACSICGEEFKCDFRHIAEPKCNKCLKTKITPTVLKEAVTEYKKESNADGSTTYNIPIEIKSEQQVMGALAGNASEAQKMGAPWMLTEFVENGSDAIKHNRKSISDNGNNFSGVGKIILEIDEKKLEVRVIDNGTGIIDPLWIIQHPFQSMKKNVDYLIGNFGRGLTGFRGLCQNLEYITLRTKVSENETNNIGNTGKCVKVSFDQQAKGQYTAIDEKEFRRYSKNMTGTVAILKNWIPSQWEKLRRNKHSVVTRMQLHFGHATEPDNFELIVRTISDKGSDEEKITKPDFSTLQPLFIKNIPTHNFLAKTSPGEINFVLYKTTPDDRRTFKEPYLLIQKRPLQDSKVRELEDFKDSDVWSSKYLTGYIECDYLHPNQLRNAIDPDENERVFIDAMRAATEDIQKELEDYIKALTVKGRDDEFKEIKDTFQEYLQKMKIPFNKTAFKISGKLTQGKASGKTSFDGRLSDKEGGINQGLIAEDGVDMAIISKHIEKRPITPGVGSVTPIPVVIKNPVSKNGVIPTKDGKSQKIVYV